MKKEKSRLLLNRIDLAARKKWGELDLSVWELSTLPNQLGQLTSLLSLNLRGNYLVVFPPCIGDIESLLFLDMSRNSLHILGSEIGKLTRLESLSLGGNYLQRIPSEIGNLSLLQELDLSNNNLADIPPEIGKCTALNSLNLSFNNLTSLPSQIGLLINLKSLSLTGNDLTSLPSEVVHLSNLRKLDLRKNPNFPLPAEILAKTNAPQAIIRAYFDYLDSKSRPLNETKLVLVGEGSVGKTALVNRLLYCAFDPNSNITEGIAIHRWHLGDQSTYAAPSIRVNVWDFGGQEIMHATHQFFLTKRTLYILVLDNRLSEAENRLDYWLQIIRSFGGNSPVLVVGNKSDQHALDLDQRSLLAAYPTVQAVLETSCATGEGIPALIEAIATQIARMPHIQDPIITTWFEVKDELEALDADYLSYTHYVELCREKSVDNPESQHVLLGFLHDLGVVLHFPDPRLETTNILNPEWVTKGVYRILNTRLPFDEQGILTWEMLARILDDEPYKKKRMFIVDMMQKFELCYELPDRKHTYLIPDLLPKETRETGAWDDALAFEVHYSVLPGSILTRLIVRMHRHIKDQTVWRTGVLLACEGNEALVRADLSANRIRIRVRGPEHGRRDLLTRIREHLGAIHSSLEGLKAIEKVPVPEHPEVEPVDYKWLRELERRGRKEITPPGLYDPIRISKLLNGIEPPEARRESETVYHIDARGSQIGGIGDQHQVKDGINFNRAPEKS